MVIDKMSDGIPCTGCRKICKKLNRKEAIKMMILKKKLDDVDECKAEITKAVNALLNVEYGKGGYILIHATDVGYLDGFDHKLDPFLQSMIPCGKFYDKYFRRHIAADGQHIVFEVIRQPEEQPLSFLNFHTKVSWNSSVADLTQDQMQTALRMASKAESPVKEETNEDSKPKTSTKVRCMQNLVQGKEIMTKKVPFVEDFAMQAKSAEKNSTILQHIKDSEYVVGELWNNSAHKLVHYISAFSKLPCGGSYYFGVHEKKEGKKLKRFVCNGFAFEEKQREEIEDAIAHKMKTNMLWVGKCPPPQKLVTVRLHPVSIETSSEQQQQQQQELQPQQHQNQQEQPQQQQQRNERQQKKEKKKMHGPPQEQQQQEQTSPPQKGNEQKRHGQQPQLQQQNQDHQQHLKKEEKMKQDKLQQQQQPQQHQQDQNLSKQQPQQKIDDEMKHKQATAISDVATHEQKGSEHIPAQRRSPLYILEIKVEHYAHGVLFHNKMGPDIFKVCDKSGQPTRISITDWVKAHDPSLTSSIFTH